MSATATAITTDTLTGIPGRLGYIPAETVVAVMAREGIVQFSLNALTDTTTGDRAGIYNRVTALAAHYGVDHAHIVAVASATTKDTLAAAHEMADHLRVLGLPATVTHAAALTEGARWTDLATGNQGAVGDPYTHPEALAHHAGRGFTVAPSREAISAVFETAEAIPDLDYARLATIDEITYTAKVLTEISQVIGVYGLPTIEQAGRVAELVSLSVNARDALLGLGRAGNAAGRVLVEIASHTRGDIRAELLTVAAAVLYAGNDTPRANIAIDHAHAALRPGQDVPRLLELITFAAGAGLHPSRLERVIRSGADTARDTYGITFQA